MSVTRPLTLAAVWLALPVVGAIIAATLEPIPPHDYWWHLAMGRLVGNGALPASNLFLYTLPVDLPFVNQPWLGQWLMWLAYDQMGHTGTVLLRNVLLGASFSLIVLTALRRSGDARAAGALSLLAAIVAYPVLTVRTRMFAFLPFAIVLWVCFGVADGRLRRRWLAVVPAVTVFWANAHGSFVLSAAVVGAVGLGAIVQAAIAGRVESRLVRDWGLVLGAVVLAGAATPLGFGAYGYVLQLTTQSSVAHSVTEWLPPDVSELRGQIFFAAVLFALAVLAVRRKHVSLSEAFVFAGTLFLAAGAIRSMFWWAGVMPVVLAPHLSALLPAGGEDVPSRAEAFVLRLVLGGLGVSLLLVQPGIGRSSIGEVVSSGQARQTGPGAWVLNHENAEAMLAKLRADGRKRVFHDQVLGGMLEYALTDQTPAQVAYVDQRMEFVPESVWARYFALSRAERNWERELARMGVDTLLLSTDSQWALVQAALVSPQWDLVGVDQSHLLLYREASLDRAKDPPK